MQTTNRTGSATSTGSHTDTHGTCAWCRQDFPSVAALLLHAEDHS